MLKSPGLQSYRGFGTPTIGKSIPMGTFYRGESPSAFSNRMLKEKGDPLAQFSGINPEAIAGRAPTKETALKLISGGEPSGSSISGVAANKIVGFNRAKVSARPSGIQSLIETLTSNVFNNNSSITNIFGGSFDKIKEALAFASFFGSKKNLDAIRDNIKILKTTFEETFDIAKELRKAINKIFKLLTGVDGFGGDGGGLIGGISGLLGGLGSRLIPGAKGAEEVEGGLAKTARLASGKQNLFSKIGSIAKGGGKLALVGGGLAAAGMGVSALSGPGETDFQPGGDALEAPGTILDKFNSILDRFDKILDGLKGGKGPASPGAKGGGSKGGGGGGGGAGGAPTLTTPPTTPINPADIKADTPEAKAAIATIRQAEGTAGKEGYSKFFGGSTYGGDLTTKTVSQVVALQKKFLAEGRGTFKGGKSAAVGAGQFMEPEVYAKKMGLDPSKQKFDEEFQNRLIVYYAKERGIDLNKPLKQTDFDQLQKIWAGLGTYYGQTSRTSAQSFQLYQKNLQKVKGLGAAPSAPVLPPPPGQTAAQAVTPQRQQAAAAGEPSVNVLNVGGGQQQAAPSGGGVVTSPPPAKNGPDVPFPSPKNPDNFLVFYSRLTYNIIDG